MREIKFRLIKDDKIVGFERWNEENGRWESSQDKKLWTDKGIVHDDKEQYILNNKNGDEIYEGDRLNVDNVGSGIVVFGCNITHTDDWQVDHKTYGFTIQWDDEDESYSELNDGERLKIIGNIHENPELLENK